MGVKLSVILHHGGRHSVSYVFLRYLSSRILLYILLCLLECTIWSVDGNQVVPVWTASRSFFSALLLSATYNPQPLSLSVIILFRCLFCSSPILCKALGLVLLSTLLPFGGEEWWLVWKNRSLLNGKSFRAERNDGFLTTRGKSRIWLCSLSIIFSARLAGGCSRVGNGC
jgi:hypothetical protein